jgi:hypothetical protein
MVLKYVVRTRVYVKVVEDEAHLICLCPLYKELRDRLLICCNLQLSTINMYYILYILMSDVKLSNNVAYFIRNASRERQTCFEK